MLPENNQESEQQDRFWLVAALLLVAFVFVGLGLSRESEPSSEARVLQANKTGDRLVWLLLTGRASKQTDIQRIVREYSKGLPDSSLDLKIAAARATLAEHHTTKVKLAHSVPDRELWQTIFSSKSLPKRLLQPSLRLVARSDLGPLEDPLISLVYSKTGDRENAEKAMQRARSAALSILNTALFTVITVFFLVVLGTVLLTIGIRQIRNLPPITPDQIYPNIAAFARYLLVYMLVSLFFKYPALDPVVALLTLPVVILIAQVASFSQLDLQNLYKRIQLKGPIWRMLGYGVAGSIAVLPLHFLFTAVSRFLFPEGPRLDPFIPMLAGGGLKATLLILIITVVGPFVEEVAFRGVLLDSLLTKMRFWPAALVSSAAFSAMHGNITYKFIPIFLFALILCYLRRKTGSLFSCWIAHVCNNAIVTILFFLS